MPRKTKILIWADGTWCHEDDQEGYACQSDDFIVLLVPEDLDDEEIGVLAAVYPISEHYDEALALCEICHDADPDPETTARKALEFLSDAISEYEARTFPIGERFQVLTSDDLPKNFRDSVVMPGDSCWALCEVLNGKIIRVVGSDGGEPEDQIFVRDWRWVVRELNELYRRYEETDAELVVLRKQLLEVPHLDLEKHEE